MKGVTIDDRARLAIAAIPAQAWTATIDTAGDLRDTQEAAVVKLTGLLAVPPATPKTCASS